MDIVEYDGSDPVTTLRQTQSLSYKFAGLQYMLTAYTMRNNVTHIKLDLSHSIMDGCSVRIVLRDVLRAYEGARDSTPGLLYKDFVQHVQNRDLKADLKYWRHHLADVEPCYFPNLGDDTSKRQLRTLSINIGDLAGEASSFCSRNNVTLFNLLQNA